MTMTMTMVARIDIHTVHLLFRVSYLVIEAVLTEHVGHRKSHSEGISSAVGAS